VEIEQLLFERVNVWLDDFLKNFEVKLNTTTVVSKFAAEKGFSFDLLVLTTDCYEVFNG
jgi:hypothetical protein